MLGINYGRIESVSVGYKTDYEMRSLDFEEFLWALGRHKDEANGMLERLCVAKSLPKTQIAALQEAFLSYCTLGRMPAVVSQFIESGTFEGSIALQHQLVTDYREDVRKYAVGLDQGRILNVFDHIPAQLAKENKKFQITKVARGARFGDYRGCIEWLIDAGVATKCSRLTFPELPRETTTTRCSNSTWLIPDCSYRCSTTRPTTTYAQNRSRPLYPPSAILT